MGRLMMEILSLWDKYTDFLGRVPVPIIEK